MYNVWLAIVLVYCIKVNIAACLPLFTHSVVYNVSTCCPIVLCCTLLIIIKCVVVQALWSSKKILLFHWALYHLEMVQITLQAN